MYRYYDIHTHQQGSFPADHFVIRNVHSDFEHAPDHCSMGLHPWYLQQPETDMESLERYAASSQVMAIGECGLDKITATDWALQLRVFEAQIVLAKRYGKPLIIHCVRAFEAVQQVLQRQQVNVPVVFHGFRKQAQIAAPLLRAGYYLSFGAALLHDNPLLAATLCSVPAQQLFLETDDADTDITHIYQAAAQIRKTDEDAIILQLQQNFKTVFDL